jgi:hypothetical protein
MHLSAGFDGYAAASSWHVSVAASNGIAGAHIRRAGCRQRDWSDSLRLPARVFGCETSYLLPAHIHGDRS